MHQVSSFFVHNPVFPLFVPQVTVNDCAGQMLASHAFCFEYGFNLAAGISGVKLIHDVQERLAADGVNFPVPFIV